VMIKFKNFLFIVTNVVGHPACLHGLTNFNLNALS
jgi:hypothetical protein